MKRRLKSHRAETLTEFLVAMILFSVIMVGVFNFVANQTKNASDIHQYDSLMFETQRWLNTQAYPISNGTYQSTNGDIEFKKDGTKLTAKLVNTPAVSMDFTIGNN